MRSWYAIRARAEGAEVSIYDEIGAYGVSAKGFLAELGALPLLNSELLGYLRDVLTRIADHPINRIGELLPWNIAATA